MNETLNDYYSFHTNFTQMFVLKGMFQPGTSQKNIYGGFITKQ